MSKALPPTLLDQPGHWVDGQFIPGAVWKSLGPMLSRSRLSSSQADQFYTTCSEQVCEYCANPRAVATDELCRQFESLAAAAARMRAALGRITPQAALTFRAHWDFLAIGQSPPVELSEGAIRHQSHDGGFLGAAWEVAADLEAAATYAADQCKPSRSEKFDDTNGRRFVWHLAWAFASVADGAAPPYSKGTWFPEFVAALAEGLRLGVRCGPGIVESAVKQWKAARPPRDRLLSLK